jgi:hypothetical protein
MDGVTLSNDVREVDAQIQVLISHAHVVNAQLRVLASHRKTLSQGPNGQLQAVLPVKSSKDTVARAALAGSPERRSLADKIASIDSQLVSNDIHRQRLLEARNKCSPINNTPVEILVEMFGLASGLEPALTDDLAAVCRHWRHVARSTPELWSVFDFETGGDPDALERWLDLSGTAPLHIRCRSRDDAGHLDFGLQLLIDDALDRMVSLHLSMSHGSLLLAINAINNSGHVNSNLKHIRFEADTFDKCSDENSRVPQLITVATPSLLSLAMCNIILHPQSGVFGPWLKELRVSPPILSNCHVWSLQDWKALLEELSSLESLETSLVLLPEQQGWGLLDGPIIKRHALRSLSMNELPHAIEPFLSLLSPELLETVLVYFAGDEGPSTGPRAFVDWAAPFFSRVAAGQNRRQLMVEIEDMMLFSVELVLTPPGSVNSTCVCRLLGDMDLPHQLKPLAITADPTEVIFKRKSGQDSREGENENEMQELDEFNNFAKQFPNARVGFASNWCVNRQAFGVHPTFSLKHSIRPAKLRVNSLVPQVCTEGVPTFTWRCYHSPLTSRWFIAPQTFLATLLARNMT